MPGEIVKTKLMKKYLFLFLIISACNKPKAENTLNEKHSSIAKKELKKFYNCDKIDHYYLNISDNKAVEILRKDNKTKDELALAMLLNTTSYPKSLSEPNFESTLKKFKFVKTELNKKKKQEVENIFSEKDSIQTVFSGCIPHYRDIFIFKNNDSIVGISKVCFGCGAAQFFGANVDTDGFGLRTELVKLEKVLRNK